MTEEIRITYKRKPGAAPNYPPENLPFPADAHIAPCNNCDVWFLESDLSKTAELICPHGGPRSLSRSRRTTISSVRASFARFTKATRLRWSFSAMFAGSVVDVRRQPQSVAHEAS